MEEPEPCHCNEISPSYINKRQKTYSSVVDKVVSVGSGRRSHVVRGYCTGPSSGTVLAREKFGNRCSVMRSRTLYK
ncbi:hypothetical protein E2C01_006391 [Portunus trituberculatus]|uniref:Uncharacterized protein n=1 Tax=Portunus trituberculatus TaxID=210409 RepID=A0A5B7CW70_PORTR|nr:hypothetical protein [Portunus trituberculatus]